MTIGNYMTWGITLPLFITAIIVIIGVAIFVFEIMIFIHAIRNSTISDERKILWLIGMLLIHPFVAIAYYFTDYKN